MIVSLNHQEVLKDGAGGAQDVSVRLDLLLIVADNRHIREAVPSQKCFHHDLQMGGIVTPSYIERFLTHGVAKEMYQDIYNDFGKASI